MAVSHALTSNAVHEREHRARDGWRLSTLELAPAAGSPRAVVVVGHASTVDRRTVVDPGRDHFPGHLVARGFAVLAPDLRGHGRSGRAEREGGAWAYDDLVADVSEYVSLARELHPGLPVALAGHSLFGHVALAWLGLHPDAPVRAHVCIASNVWNHRFNHGALRWLEKRAVVEAASAAARIARYVHARRAGAGSFEAARHWQDTVRGNRWVSRDGTDYHAGLERVGCPVLVVVSEGDRIVAAPDDTLAFTARLGPRREVLRTGHRTSPPPLRAVAPGHMGLLTDPWSAPVWDAIAVWLERTLGLEASEPRHT